MEWRAPSASGKPDPKATPRAVHLAYGLNLHAPRTLEEALEGLRAVTVPLRERLAPGRRFGVGIYLPAELAGTLAGSGGRAELDAWTGFLVEHGLDPFTFNAFPFGDFQTDGLKQRVFQPAWTARARLDYTLDVARIADHAWRATGGVRKHISISTHTGSFGELAANSAEEGAAAAHLARCTLELARMRDNGGAHIVLALEPEPRANCGDTAAFAAFFPRLVDRAARFLVREHFVAAPRAESIVRAHLGTCVDACHAAVEFEEPSVVDARPGGPVLGKLQFSSALAVKAPATNAIGRAALLALDEPRFLHQVTGRKGRERIRANDLPKLAAELAHADQRPAGLVPGGEVKRAQDWLACDEWRCHFHVPVDLEDARGPDGEPLGLATTRATADLMLARALARKEPWPLPELHLEIETYTWHVLPGFARTSAALIDGLEREYRHVMGELARAGWTPGAGAP